MTDNVPTLSAEDSLPLLYELAHSDTRWAKERSSLTAYWAIALQVGVLALHLPVAITALVIAVPTLFGSFHLVDLHRFAVERRGISDAIAARMQGTAGLHPARAADKNHVSYLLMQIGAMIASAAVCLLAASR
jgi:hypothetical protein